MSRQQNALTELARLGFGRLAEVREQLDRLDAALPGVPLLPEFVQAADPDQALRLLVEAVERHPVQTCALLEVPGGSGRLIRLLGASEGLGEFFLRNPDELAVLARPLETLPSVAEYRRELAAAVQVGQGGAAPRDEGAWSALRVRYRRLLAELAAYDLTQSDPLAAMDGVAAALSDLAAAALDASLAVARGRLASSVPPAELAATRLAIVGMGKAGARELNYVSDVDVIFVAEAAEGVEPDRAVELATRLAIETMRGVQEPGREPPLWDVDTNLRPEGKDGALVRSLESHVTYYQRWAKSWEFQALLKARPIAGDLELGQRYAAAVAPMVWSSAARENFVESVQRMRERVTENIPADQVEHQLKLGPGGLRDIEFTVQLLQMVHGLTDDGVRQAATLDALAALAAAGYIGRAEAAEFSADYRFLRLLEHRLQLGRLRRTHLMPHDPDGLRVLARATGVAATAAELAQRWSETKRAVRSLHERLFYRPLLSAVAALPEDGLALSSDQAAARLSAIGFRDAKGALAHISAMTAGVSRRAAIQRNLLPVMLQWLAEGADPDYGLLALRRLGDRLGESHWYLRMLRDSSGAAQELTAVLSGSRFAGELLDLIPEAVAWLENPDDLRPRPAATLLDEALATVLRHEAAEPAVAVLRAARRREVLRVAIAAILGRLDVEELGLALSDITTALLAGVLAAVRGGRDDGMEFAIIAMGRFGGRELGFGSDADVMYVYRAGSASPESAQSRAEEVVGELARLTEDLRLPLDLDIGLRPEGKNGVTVRSLDSYREYYRRWALTWESQALLRARPIAGDAALMSDFEGLADTLRFPEELPDAAVREVKRIKARVEAERLPQGADPRRHLKLGRGSLSDVEWLVQLMQLQHAAAIPSLRTTSTLGALEAVAEAGLIDRAAAATLRSAWVFASRARSAMTLWSGKTADVLPVDRAQLEGIARLMGYPPGSANALEGDYLRVTRRARQVFEQEFYGPAEHPAHPEG